MDLFVRVSNQVAVNMYKQLGYSVYRTVIEYYSASNGEPDEDAYGDIDVIIYNIIISHYSRTVTIDYYIHIILLLLYNMKLLCHLLCHCYYYYYIMK